MKSAKFPLRPPLRFLTKDPIGLAGGDVNLYRYAGNNPHNFVDAFGLTQRDIDVGIKIIQETQKDLRFPNKVDPSMISDQYAGEYSYLKGTIILNTKYLNELTDKQAADLLDTLIHETLHANDPLWKQILDTIRDHPDIDIESARRTKEILDRYLRERVINPCEK